MKLIVAYLTAILWALFVPLFAVYALRLPIPASVLIVGSVLLFITTLSSARSWFK